MIALLAVLAFGICAATMPAYLAISRRRFLDTPGARSSHSVPTPTGGGLPAMLAFVIVSTVAVAIDAVPGGTRYVVTIGCASVLAVLGFLDDARDLPVGVRFCVQTAVALAIVHWLGHPGPQSGALGFLAAALSVVIIVGAINAFNFMDGIDALVGGTGIVIVCVLAVLTQDPLWFLLAASYAGFLLFNLPPARVFMGDAGSTALGGLVAIALFAGRDHLEPRHLLLFGPLIGDSAYTVVRRLLRGENVLRAHRTHLYQRLIRVGHSHAQVSASYMVATLAMGVLAIVGGTVGAIVGAAACMGAIVLLERYLSARTEPPSGNRKP